MFYRKAYDADFAEKFKGRPGIIKNVKFGGRRMWRDFQHGLLRFFRGLSGQGGLFISASMTRLTAIIIRIISPAL